MPFEAQDTIPDNIDDLRIFLRGLRADIRENTDATLRIEIATAELVHAYVAAQGFWQVIGWVASAGKKLAGLAGIFAAGWLAFEIWVKAKMSG